jgi:hypothetical protein
MAKKCVQCGQENDDSSLRCVCGADLPAEAALVPAATTTTEPVGQASSPSERRKLLLGRIMLLVAAIAVVPLSTALRKYLNVPPPYRCLVGTCLFCGPAIAGLWLLGREPHRTLRLWRLCFVLWMIFLTPVLLAVLDGIVEDGWPRGRHHRSIAHALIIIITLTAPALLAGLAALLRTYRLAGVLALVAGLAAVVDGVLLLRASWQYSLAAQRLDSVVGIIGFGSKLESYVSIPAGLALVVGGVMTWRAARARAVAARPTIAARASTG